MPLRKWLVVADVIFLYVRAVLNYRGVDPKTAGMNEPNYRVAERARDLTSRCAAAQLAARLPTPLLLRCANAWRLAVDEFAAAKQLR